MKERRGCKRYRVHEDVYVYRAKRVGKIRNISLTGLLCNCVHHNECLPVEFDIFCPGSSICLGSIPYTIIEAREIESPPHFVRECHVQFDPLSHEKNLELERFIEKYTFKND
jgi:hypothetical protein